LGLNIKNQAIGVIGTIGATKNINAIGATKNICAIGASRPTSATSVT
jgi:hypothetical protein